jgi:glycosyltransferase involved in cell wall biosynthesis
VRILHFSKYYAKGGASKAALQSVLSQRAAGIDALLCVGRRTGQSHEWLLEPNPVQDLMALGRFALERLPSRLCGVDRFDTRSIAVTGIDGPKLAREMGADLCVLHNIDGLLSVETISRFACPVVWRVHDMWAMCGSEHYTSDEQAYRCAHAANPPDYLSAWTFQRKVKAFSKLSSLTICSPSRWLAREFESSELFHDRQVVVIPNGVDTSRFTPQDRRAARLRLNLNPDNPIVAFGAAMGTADPRKGFDLLLRSLRQHVDRFKEQNIRIALFGGGTIPGLDLDVHNFGSVEDRSTLCDIYSAASVIVVPSRMENLSLMVLEALSCGTPVVAFKIGGMPDMIIPGRTGWLVEPFNIDLLADHVLDGARISEKNSQVRSQCRDAILGNFTLEVEAREMRRMFENILYHQPSFMPPVQ